MGLRVADTLCIESGLHLLVKETLSITIKEKRIEETADESRTTLQRSAGLRAGDGSARPRAQGDYRMGHSDPARGLQADTGGAGALREGQPRLQGAAPANPQRRLQDQPEDRDGGQSAGRCVHELEGGGAAGVQQGRS